MVAESSGQRFVEPSHGIPYRVKRQAEAQRNKTMYLEFKGQYRTDSLFSERINKRQKEAGYKPVYCLIERKAYDNVKSLYDIFINSIDEYDFAIQAFGSKAHLDKLKSIKWFTQGWRGCSAYRGYNAWLDDMKERDASIAKKVIMDQTKGGNISAARKLSDMSKTTETAKTGAGRPKAEDIKRESVRIAEEKSDIQDDLNRLNSAKVIKLRG